MHLLCTYFWINVVCILKQSFYETHRNMYHLCRLFFIQVSHITIFLENHRLQSAYDNHLIVKLVSVGATWL